MSTAILIPEDRMLELLAATTAFQNWCGIDPLAELEARKAAARLHLYTVEIAREEFIPTSMPCALIYLEPYEGTRGSAGANSFKFQYGIEVVFFAQISPSVKRITAQRKTAIKAFNEVAFGIAAGASAIADGVNHILLRTATQMFPATLNGFEIDEEGGVDWPYLCTAYRWTADRMGATAG